MYTHSKEAQKGLKNKLHELIKISFTVDAHLHVFVSLTVRDKLHKFIRARGLFK